MGGINKEAVELTGRLIDISYGKPLSVISGVQALHDMNPGSQNAVQTAAKLGGAAAGFFQVALSFATKVGLKNPLTSAAAFVSSLTIVIDKLNNSESPTREDWYNLASNGTALTGDLVIYTTGETGIGLAVGVALKAGSVALAGMAVLSGSAPSSTQASFDAAAQQFADKRGQIAPTPDGDIALYDVIPGEKADSLLGNDAAYVAKVIAISAEGVTYWLEDDGSGSLTISRTTPDGQYAPLVPDDIQQATTEGTYTVDVDDNLPDIAEKFHTSVEKINGTESRDNRSW
ncbi:hypothetical protein [Syntrophorhabdus aromaticivorans]|uniref:hypothetical protein n=1 Tax=Syntrophorhabdus aromaticivorans TaxID=328301 RepID=UPI0003F7528D|nr:hypothetical protein [Syntrophorhabdus aromaticivorans]